MSKTLSVAMIAMNEEANLPRTLESVRWADEIILVDSGSKDRTLEVAQSFGAKTSYHDFGGHGEQKNVALDFCTSEWVLLLDADEVLTPELQQEIRELLAGEPKYGAYWIPRLNLIFGRWMRHGSFYPDRKLRLFKRGAARLSEGVGPHSTPQFTGPKGKLKHDMLHYAYPNMVIYLEHMNRYSSEIAQLLVRDGRSRQCGMHRRQQFRKGRRRRNDKRFGQPQSPIPMRSHHEDREARHGSQSGLGESLRRSRG